MGLTSRPVRAGAIAVMGLAIAGSASAFAARGAMAAPAVTGPHLVALKSSVNPTTDKITGAYTSSRMSVEVALAPRNAAGLARSLRALYTKHSGSYHKWLRTGQYDARYAPTTATRDAVRNYLKSEGLRIAKSSFAVPGSCRRLEPSGNHRVPHHAEQLPRPARDEVLRQLNRGRTARRDRVEGLRRRRPDQHGPRAVQHHARAALGPRREATAPLAAGNPPALRDPLPDRAAARHRDPRRAASRSVTAAVPAATA